MGMYGKPEIMIDCSKDPVITKQSFADEVDINKIVARFEKTGMVEHINRGTPFYGDVSELVDLKQAMEIVTTANDLFNGLSAEIRNRFANDPVQMVEFLQDPKNLDEAIKLGMVIPKPDAPSASPAPAAPVTPPSGGK